MVTAHTPMATIRRASRCWVCGAYAEVDRGCYAHAGPHPTTGKTSLTGAPGPSPGPTVRTTGTGANPMSAAQTACAVRQHPRQHARYRPAKPESACAVMAVNGPRPGPNRKSLCLTGAARSVPRPLPRIAPGDPRTRRASSASIPLCRNRSRRADFPASRLRCSRPKRSSSRPWLRAPAGSV